MNHLEIMKIPFLLLMGIALLLSALSFPMRIRVAFPTWVIYMEKTILTICLIFLCIGNAGAIDQYGLNPATIAITVFMVGFVLWALKNLWFNNITASLHTDGKEATS